MEPMIRLASGPNVSVEFLRTLAWAFSNFCRHKNPPPSPELIRGLLPYMGVLLAHTDSPEGAYLMTSVLEGVFDRGTARVTRDWGLTDRLAGKTGTSNGRRDSWFAGYAPNRATAVWVGYDDNSKTRMSGGRAALPIWARFTVRVRPAGGFPIFRQPAGIVTAVVDPESGGLATDRCPLIETEVFLRNQVPEYLCDLHGRGFREERWDRRRPVERRHPVRRFFRRIFGDG